MRSSTDWARLGAVAAAVVAFVLGIVGLAQVGETGPLDLAYGSLQLFVLGNDPAEHPGGAWVLNVARFLAPATTVYAVAEALRAVLGERWERRRTARSERHAIVCGDTRDATALARNLGRTGAVVVTTSRTTATELRRERIRAVVGDPGREATLRAAGLAGAAELYACSPSSTANLSVALLAGQVRSADRGLQAYAQVRDDELAEALQVSRGGPRAGRLDLFTTEDAAAAVLLREHAPAEPVLVEGFGDLGRAVLRALLRRPGSRRVLVRPDATDPDPAAEAERLQAAEYGVAVEVLPADADPPRAAQVYVCRPDEDGALVLALGLARLVELPVVVCVCRTEPLSGAFAGMGLTVFGVDDEACTRAAIEEVAIVRRVARVIHEHYRTAGEQRGDTDGPAHLPWGALPPDLREANIAQAEHLGVRLAAVGAVATPDPRGEELVLGEAELEKLARLEHVRWRAEREAAGYRLGPRGPRTHPDLVGWEELSESSKLKDLDTARALPAVLAAAGLHLRRLPRGDRPAQPAGS